MRNAEHAKESLLDSCNAQALCETRPGTGTCLVGGLALKSMADHRGIAGTYSTMARTTEPCPRGVWRGGGLCCRYSM